MLKRSPKSVPRQWDVHSAAKLLTEPTIWNLHSKYHPNGDVDSRGRSKCQANGKNMTAIYKYKWHWESKKFIKQSVPSTGIMRSWENCILELYLPMSSDSFWQHIHHRPIKTCHIFFQFLQGTAATDLRRGDGFNSRFFCSSFTKSTVTQSFYICPLW